MKPSEKTPTAFTIMAELFQEAGLPDGVARYPRERRNSQFYLDNEDIRAISFIGSNQAGHTFTSVEQRMEKGCRRIWEQKTMQVYYQMLTRAA